jgi:DNA-binding LacI/PurR family transcriptional regulator
MAKAARPGLREVAQLAGVSVKTASNVLGGYANVTREKTELVKKAAKELGYRPNLGARSLRGGRSGLIGLAVPNLRIPYFAEIAHSVIEAAAIYKWTILIDQTDGVFEREKEVISGIRPHLIDGLIYSPIQLSGEELVNTAENLPIVIIGENGQQKKFDYVSIDNVRAAKDATNHLITVLKRKNIAVIGKDENTHSSTGRIRVQGYKEALKENKISIDNKLIFSVTDFTHIEGYLAATSLIKNKIKFDALFCFNDLLAVGAMKLLAEAGLRVPEDVAVIGFDDTDEGNFHTPSITSVSPDKDTIAKIAVTLLNDRIDGTFTGPARNIVVGHSITFRQSAPEHLNLR